MIYLYRIFLWLYPRIAWLIGFTNPKARRWREGRKGIFRKLSETFYQHALPVVWVHCASLGEFEQALPVLEALRKNHPRHTILLTFFSPSGYEVRKDHASADHVFYLPMDSAANASRFLDIVQPSLVLFVKYEFWYFYLRETRDRSIPLLLISGIFRKDQPFFKWYGSLHRKMLSCFTFLFVQNESSAQLLRSIGFQESVIVSGDTRFDRVIDIAARFEPIPAIEAFCDGHPVIVAGSTWTEDDEELDHFANTHLSVRFIVAPHDIDRERLNECSGLYKHSILYSNYIENDSDSSFPDTQINVLIIDNIGMLSKLYRYATICYVGGGFGDEGIHNILEAAVYGKPVVFGPVYDKYVEADALLDAGGAFSIEDALELEQLLKELLSGEGLAAAASSAGQYVRQNAGATAKLMGYIQEKRLLIS